MFISRGLGLAVVGLTFAALLLTEVGVESLFADETYYQTHGWPILLGFGLAAGLVWLLSIYIGKRPARVVIDKQTGEEFTLNDQHDLFFVPLKYWPAILVATGFAFMVFA